MEPERLNSSHGLVRAFSAATCAYGACTTSAERRLGFIECQRAFNQMMLTWAQSGEPATTIAPATVQSSPPAAQPEPMPGPHSMHAALTKQQMVVAHLIANGMSNRQIAARLTITSGTVANHVANILNRLGVDNRVQIAVWTGGDAAAPWDLPDPNHWRRN